MKQILYFIVIMIVILLWMVSTPFGYLIAFIHYIVDKIKGTHPNMSLYIIKYIGWGDIALNKIDSYFKM